MNILPKKRWHVRTKDNIARVRRDEAQAAEEEKEKERRIKLAEKEVRRDLMRARARAAHGLPDVVEEKDEGSVKKEHKLEHVNFFEEEEAGLVSSTAKNKEHEEEQKQEKEKYEKQIGYLTYLGQDTNEATGNVSWYNKCPEREAPELSCNEEMGLKHKFLADPMNSFRKHCSTFRKTSASASLSLKPSTSEPTEIMNRKSKRGRSRTPEKSSKDNSHHKKKKRKKHKKEKHHKSFRAQKSPEEDSSNSSCETEKDFSDDEDEKKAKLEKLRAERLRREREEKKRADRLMAKMNGVAYIDEDEKPQPKPIMKQRYNTQFNPDIAKQNYEDQKYRF